MQNWTQKDLKDKNLVSNKRSVYVNVKSLVAKGKVSKLPNMIERAIVQETPNNALISAPVCEAKIFIKPFSVNKAYRGKIYKTDYHKNYITAVTLLLPNHLIIPDGRLKVEYEFGFSSNGGDLDNPLKVITDILARKYHFNDNRIMQALVRKMIVPKGQEYLKFKIDSYDNI